MKRWLCILLVLSGSAACSSGPARTAHPPPNDLRAQNLDLVSAVPARIGFQTTGPSADVIVNFIPTAARIRLCALSGVDGALPDLASCTDASTGVRETVTGAGTLGGLAIVSDRDAVRADVFVEYDAATRAVALRLPAVRIGGPDCQDEGCNPLLELSPLHNGPFTAHATWSGGDGVLVLLQGSVLGRSARATGIPYREAARANGSSPRSIVAEMSAPGEYALVVRQDPGASARGLRDVRVDATWS